MGMQQVSQTRLFFTGIIYYYTICGVIRCTAPCIRGLYRVSKNVLYPKMQNFKNFYYNKDNQIWYFDLFKW